MNLSRDFTFVALAYVFALSPAFASELCEKNYIESFTLAAKFLHYPSASPNIDYCQLPKEEVPEVINVSIQAMGEVHRQVAIYFGFEPSNLFLHERLKVNFEPGLNPIDYQFHFEQIIQLRQVPDWVWTQTNFDSSLYIHELTHAVMANKNLSNVFGPIEQNKDSTWTSPVVSEGLPDFVAIILKGGLATDVEKLALPKQIQTYLRGPIFRMRHGFTTLQSDFLEAHTVFGISEGYTQVIDQPLNTSIRQFFEQAKNSSDFLAKDLEELLTSREKFDPDLCFAGKTFKKWNRNLCSAYNLGSALNSFLLALRTSVGHSEFDRIFTLSIQHIAKHGLIEDKYVCEATQGEQLYKQVISLPRGLKTWLKTLVELGISADLFDDLAKQYGLEKGIAVDDLYHLHQLTYLPFINGIRANLENDKLATVTPHEVEEYLIDNHFAVSCRALTTL